jgi:hypothetical protein
VADCPRCGHRLPADAPWCARCLLTIDPEFRPQRPAPPADPVALLDGAGSGAYWLSHVVESRPRVRARPARHLPLTGVGLAVGGVAVLVVGLALVGLLLGALEFVTSMPGWR